MRVLKFRIWDKLMGKMYQHNDIVFIDFKHCNVRFEWDINVGEDGQNTGNYYASFPERLELQEFTGLHDKNGAGDVCLFEGDILSLDGKIIGNIYEYEIKAHESESYIVVPKITSKAWIHSVQKIMDSGFGYTE